MISAVTRFPSIAADTPALSREYHRVFRLRSVTISTSIRLRPNPAPPHRQKEWGPRAVRAIYTGQALRRRSIQNTRGNHDSLGDTGVVIQPVFVFPHLQEGIVQSMVRVPDAMDGGAVRPRLPPAPFQDGYGTPSNASSAPPVRR